MASVLQERDTNAQIASPTNAKDKSKSLEYHRAVLESRVKDDKSSKEYVSPSDTILSPATQKLAAFKNKHMGKSMKPQTLFAKTVANNAANSGNTRPMFGDMGSQKSS